MSWATSGETWRGWREREGSPVYSCDQNCLTEAGGGAGGADGGGAGGGGVW